LAFQYPDKIADAIRLFSSCELWPSVATAMATTAEDVRSRLRLIVERRNKIVHEADVDPSYPDARWPITKADTDGVNDFIEELCEKIHLTVA
jgi:hypothetical protein